MADYYRARTQFEKITTTEINFNGRKKSVRLPAFGPSLLKKQCHALKAFEAKLRPTFPVKPDELRLPPAKRQPLKFNEDQFFRLS